jgi:hypothetical protein
MHDPSIYKNLYHLSRMDGENEILMSKGDPPHPRLDDMKWSKDHELSYWSCTMYVQVQYVVPRDVQEKMTPHGE